MCPGRVVGAIDEGGGRLGFRVEPMDSFVRSQLTSQDHLDRDDAVEFYLSCLEDNAHAAAGNLLQEFIVAE